MKKLEISKEWCLAAAEREGDSEIGAGVLAMDPTARGDMIADEVRRWYEANRETWWDRHKFWPFSMSSPDRTGAHADEFMLGLINAVHAAGRNNGE